MVMEIQLRVIGIYGDFLPKSEMILAVAEGTPFSKFLRHLEDHFNLPTENAGDLVILIEGVAVNDHDIVVHDNEVVTILQMVSGG